MGPLTSPSSGPSREEPERSTAGQQAADGWCSTTQLEAHLSVAGRGILKPMLRPGGRGLLPGAVSPTRYPDIRRAPATAYGSRGPCAGQTLYHQ
jgi:hypothetical protein